MFVCYKSLPQNATRNPPPFGLPPIGLPQFGLTPFGLTPYGLTPKDELHLDQMGVSPNDPSVQMGEVQLWLSDHMRKIWANGVGVSLERAIKM